MKWWKISIRENGLIMVVLLFIVILQMAIVYKSLNRNTTINVLKVDERIQLDLIANSLTELAMLKFKLYPEEFLTCIQAARSGQPDYLADFSFNAPEFKLQSNLHSTEQSIVIAEITSMEILNESHENTKALLIEAQAQQFNRVGQKIVKKVKRIFSLENSLNVGEFENE